MKLIMLASMSLVFACITGTISAGDIPKQNGKLPCLSGVCLGEDVDSLKVNWINFDQLGSLTNAYQDPLGEDEAQAKQFVQNSVVGLQTGEVRRLMPYLARKSFDKKALQLLRSKRPIFCSGWPLEGAFLSDSGRLTKVRVVQDTDQKLKVVSIERYYKGLNETQSTALWAKLAEQYPETTYGPDSLVAWGQESGVYVVTFRHPVWTVGKKEYVDRWGASFQEIRKLYQDNPSRSGGKNDFDYVLSKNSQCRGHIAID